ncbi:MAG: hypothetical protein IT307_06420, partial [Chloroflexi bacterium]|nr:hypothetical protein [Chloroflexota bacterium]
WPVLQAPFREWDDAILKGSTDLPMEVNNVICLEVNLWEWGVGGIKAEQTVVVTPTGNELICKQERILTVKR